MVIKINQIKKEHEEQQDEFELIDKGEYPCFVYDLEGKESSNGNPMIEVVLKIAKGEYKNRQLWTYLTLTAKAWFKVEEFFEAVGYDIDDLPEEVETPEQVVAHIKDDVLGSKVKIKLEHRKYEGKDTENIKKVMKLDEDIGEVDLDDEDVPF